MSSKHLRRTRLSCVNSVCATQPYSGQSLAVRHGHESDLDVLVDLDPELPISVFQYARLKLYIDKLLGGASDVVNRRKLKPLLRENILREAVNVF